MQSNKLTRHVNRNECNHYNVQLVKNHVLFMIQPQTINWDEFQKHDTTTSVVD